MISYTGAVAVRNAVPGYVEHVAEVSSSPWMLGGSCGIPTPACKQIFEFLLTFIHFDSSKQRKKVFRTMEWPAMPHDDFRKLKGQQTSYRTAVWLAVNIYYSISGKC